MNYSFFIYSKSKLPGQRIYNKTGKVFPTKREASRFITAQRKEFKFIDRKIGAKYQIKKIKTFSSRDSAIELGKSYEKKFTPKSLRKF